MSVEIIRKFESFMRACMFMRSELRWSRVCIEGDGFQRMESISPAWLWPDDEQPMRSSGVPRRAAMVKVLRSVRVVFMVELSGKLWPDFIMNLCVGPTSMIVSSERA